jgi:hypothetical protein
MNLLAKGGKAVDGNSGFNPEEVAERHSDAERTAAPGVVMMRAYHMSPAPDLVGETRRFLPKRQNR